MNKYSVIIQWSEADNVFIATVPELPGLSAFGETPAKAAEELAVAQELYIETLKEDEETLPEAEVLCAYSGQLRIRIPKSLHASLSNEAKREGISLNMYIVSLLSERNALHQIKREVMSSRSTVFSPGISAAGWIGAAGFNTLVYSSEQMMYANASPTVVRRVSTTDKEWMDVNLKGNVRTH